LDSKKALLFSFKKENAMFIKQIKFLPLLLILAAFACTKDFEEINQNPNNPVKASSAFLLTSAQKSLTDNIYDEWFTARFGNQFAQYWASNSYTNESRYTSLQSRISDPYWRLHYNTGLEDLYEIIRQCNETPREVEVNGNVDNQKAVALILQSFVFQILTDSWGAIPYTDALKGSAVPFPKYDDQRTIYLGLLSAVNEANSLIKTSEPGPAGDQVYGGDMTQWKKFCNSLKMRIAMRMADKEDALAKTAIQEAFAAGVITSNNDIAAFHYLGALPNANPIYEDFLTRKDFASSNTMVDTLLKLNDPRVAYYYEPATASGDFIGEVYGMTDGQAASTTLADVSQRGALVLAADFPAIYLDAAEVHFILAEAKERWPDLALGGTSAKAFYDGGINVSMQFWSGGTLSPGDIAGYTAQPGVDYDALKAAGLTWKQIIGCQKWIALYTQGIQGWSEYRRLDFGILKKPRGLASFNDPAKTPESVIPLRLIYPSEENSLNGVNYQAAIAAQGANSLRTRLWWDVQ